MPECDTVSNIFPVFISRMLKFSWAGRRKKNSFDEEKWPNIVNYKQKNGLYLFIVS